MRKLPVVLLCRTISILQKSTNQKYSPVIPPQHEGRYGQSSRNVRRGCDGRVDAGRRAVSCVRRSRVVPTPRCWCQPPGHKPGGTVTRKPGTPRRARNKSSNIARGMPDVFGCTCDQLVCVLLLSLHTRARVQRRPAFPAPSVLKEGIDRITRTKSSRESVDACLHRHCADPLARNDDGAFGCAKPAFPHTASTR